MKRQPKEVAPCTIYCPGCSSFNSSCLGCSSNIHNKSQKRESKWSCIIRRCCLDNNKFTNCAFCAEFPCEKIHHKLIQTHIGDKRYQYRHEIPDNGKKIRILGIEEYIIIKRKDYSCPECNGIILFYHDMCNSCGYKKKNK